MLFEYLIILLELARVVVLALFQHHLVCQYRQSRHAYYLERHHVHNQSLFFLRQQLDLLLPFQSALLDSVYCWEFVLLGLRYHWLWRLQWSVLVWQTLGWLDWQRSWPLP